jgi:hypothetical protein
MYFGGRVNQSKKVVDDENLTYFIIYILYIIIIIILYIIIIIILGIDY